MHVIFVTDWTTDESDLFWTAKPTWFDSTICRLQTTVHDRDVIEMSANIEDGNQDRDANAVC